LVFEWFLDGDPFWHLIIEIFRYWGIIGWSIEDVFDIQFVSD